jgi:hypothetical protein
MGKNFNQLERENRALKDRNRQLKNLCEEKDSFFLELMSDALRHGSSVAAKHMADRKKYLHGK